MTEKEFLLSLMLLGFEKSKHRSDGSHRYRLKSERMSIYADYHMGKISYSIYHYGYRLDYTVKNDECFAEFMEYLIKLMEEKDD